MKTNLEPFECLNIAIWNFDLFLSKGKKEYLLSADKYMTQYRQMGGDMYTETEKKIKKYLASYESIQ